MLPGSLVSSYEQYKHDTAVISSWLVHTARQNGYTVSSKAGKSARVKGKARKQMREQTKTTDKNIGGGVKKTGGRKHRYEYVLPIKDFVPLAEFIAAVSKPKRVEIPTAVLSTLSRVIRVRTSFAAGLEKAQGSLDADAAVGHSYFVGILEKVRNILKPSAGPLDLSDVREAVPQTSANVFSALEVYNTSEAFLNAPDVDVPMTDHAPEQEDSVEDAYIAFCSLLQDANSLRGRIKGLWNGYVSGSIDLASVSVATNTAIHLVRQMEQDIASLIVKHGGFLKWSYIFYAASCNGLDEDSDKRVLPGDDINVDTYDLADHCMIPVWLNLDAFQRAHEPGVFSAYNGRYGLYDPSLDQAQLSNRQKYGQDKAALCEIFGDISLVMTFKTNPCEDAFVCGVRQMLRTDFVPFWTAFAGQVYLDTLKCLQGPSSSHLRPFREMEEWNTAMASSVTAAQRYHRDNDLHIRNWLSSNDAGLKLFIDDCHYWADDPIDRYRQRLNVPFERHLFLRRHALFCGLWIHHMRSVFHVAGVTLTQAWGGTLFTGQLYHAIRRSLSSEVPRWDDMELLIMQQGVEQFFVGGLPKDAHSDFKNYCLCLGYSAANWAPSRPRQGGRLAALASKKGPRSLKEQADVSMRFDQLIGGGMDGGGMAPADVKLILASSQWTQTLEGDQIAMEKTFPAASAWGRGKDKPPVGEVGKNGRKEGEEGEEDVTLAGWVLKLALALQAEVAEVSFDYFSMHITCWTMLKAMNSALRDKLCELFAPEYLEDDSQLPFLVGYIFMMAAGKRVVPGEDPLALMRLAAPPMKQIIQEQGCVIQERLGRSGTVFVIENENDE